MAANTLMIFVKDVYKRQMGHIPEAKYSEMHEAYMNGELTTKEFVDWYNIMIRNIEKNNLIAVSYTHLVCLVLQKWQHLP